jgi:hypothetical protein
VIDDDGTIGGNVVNVERDGREETDNDDDDGDDVDAGAAIRSRRRVDIVANDARRSAVRLASSG